MILVCIDIFKIFINRTHTFVEPGLQSCNNMSLSMNQSMILLSLGRQKKAAMFVIVINHTPHYCTDTRQTFCSLRDSMKQ